jgi:transcriptional regulator with XRE-family HTH domain
MNEYDDDDDEDAFRPGVAPTRQQTLAMRIGLLMQNIRAARNLPQREFAALVGVSQRTVCRFERGGGNPSIALVERMFGFHEVRLDVHQEPPRTTTLVIGERTLRVRPLPDVEASHADVARVMRRVRARGEVG